MTPPRWFHFTASVSKAVPDLSLAETGAWLWGHLREAFAAAIAVVLMPDHLHLLMSTLDAVAQQQRLSRLLGHFGRRFGAWGRTSRVADPVHFPAGLKLARQVRYVLLNPCRDRLARCPLEWPWSTHRDVVGATAMPWITAERLAPVFSREPDEAFLRRFHYYVSPDPSTHVDGTPLPEAAQTSPLPMVDVGTIIDASTAALRLSPAAIRTRRDARSLFVALAFDQGWTHLDRLGQLCACSPRTIRRDAADVQPAALQAARLCLGDARLRRAPA